MGILIVCSLISRFFLNLRAIAHDNPLVLPRGTTGFALDTTSLMAKIMRRKPTNLNSNLNAAGPSVCIGASHPVDGANIGLSGNHISAGNIDPEAGVDGGDKVDSVDREYGHSAV